MNYRQTYKGAIQNYVRKYIRVNYWKVKEVISKEDLEADGYRLYRECYNRYIKTVDNPAWFMSLFKKAFNNYFFKIAITASLLRRNRSSIEEMEEIDPGSIIDRNVDYNLGELIIKLEEAPDIVKKVLELLIDNTDLMQHMEELYHEQGLIKTQGNTFLCRLLGYDPNAIDLIRLVKNYFK